MKIAFVGKGAAARRRCPRCSSGTWPAAACRSWPSTPTSTSTSPRSSAPTPSPPGCSPGSTSRSWLSSPPARASASTGSGSATPGDSTSQGRPFSLDDLSAGTAAALSAIQSRLDAAPRDWARYTSLAAEFHRRNARAWASDQAGEVLADQIDPDFTLGPHALALTAT